MSKIGTSFYETKHIQTTTTKIRRLRIGDLIIETIIIIRTTR